MTLADIAKAWRFSRSSKFSACGPHSSAAHETSRSLKLTDKPASFVIFSTGFGDITRALMSNVPSPRGVARTGVCTDSFRFSCVHACTISRNIVCNRGV